MPNPSAPPRPSGVPSSSPRASRPSFARAHADVTPRGRVAFAAATDKGCVRDQNEDAFLAMDLGSGRRLERGELAISEHGLLLAVSDGMGGARAGEVASALSLDALVDELRRDQAGGGVSERLRRVVMRANRRVHEASRRPGRRGMGATLTVALLCDATVHLAQIGDSRAYLLRDGALRQLTHDQSYVQLLVDQGVLTPEEAERSPDKSVLLQAMGQSGDVHVGLGKLGLHADDRILLCSDGLTNELPIETIAGIASADDLPRACEALIAAANDAGGRDNVTVVLARVR